MTGRIRFASALLISLFACGSPPRQQSASAVASAPPTASSSPPVTSPPPTVAPPVPEPPKFVLYTSLEEVPEPLRASLPAKLDFHSRALAGYLRPGNAVEVIERPAVVEERGGVLHVVGVVRHVPAPTRRCPGGRYQPDDSSRHELAGSRAGPNFLVVLDRARALRARSIAVEYRRDVEDPPKVDAEPHGPCPKYP